MNPVNPADYKGKSQQDQVLQYLKDFGSISPKEAWDDLGCTKLATRISELQRKGYLFIKTDETCTARFGNRATYKRYRLVGTPVIT